MKEWLVAGAVIEGPEGILLVANRRRDGSVDWSTPGGVIDPGEAVLEGLAREVREETGLEISSWDGLLYRIEVDAPDLGWHLQVEVHRAATVVGEVCFADPDGIVIDAAYVHSGECETRMGASHPWVREPLAAWLAERWLAARAFRYHLAGQDPGSFVVTTVP